MKLFTTTITVKTQALFEFKLLDEEINQAIAESKIKKGFLLLRSPHNTATIICNEDDRTVLKDMEKNLKRLLPENFPWTHNYEGTDNARAHQIVSLLGHTHWLVVEDGKMKLGTWQKIFLLELFEARQRRVEVVVVGE
jgi:secondary thiamine-phosphate synthase enzyme